MLKLGHNIYCTLFKIMSHHTVHLITRLTTSTFSKKNHLYFSFNNLLMCHSPVKLFNKSCQYYSPTPLAITSVPGFM